MLRRFFVVFALVTSGHFLVAGQAVTATISGVVRAADKPQADITVRAIPSARADPAGTAKTAPDGTYKLTVPPGVYHLEFSGTGFATAIRTGIVLLPDSSTEVNVILEKEGAALADQGVPGLKSGEIGVELMTKFGVILLAIDAAHAPITAGNFFKYLDGGFYNGGRFHRATRPDNYTPAPPNRPAMALVQAGINPARQSDTFPPIKLERTSVTGLKHVAGTVSMARGTTADTATSDFFILLDDQPSLDFGGKRFDDGQGAAAFGRVLFGINVVKQIQQQPVDGQNLTPPVSILWATRWTP
jgi:peptidyl-prolyl cis-trans isomerase A (cyclophilin A)